MITVLLADNQALTREGTIALLTPVKDIKVMAIADTVAELKNLQQQHNAQVIVMDHYFDIGGITELANYFSPAAIVILSNSQQRAEVQELIDSGIKNHVSKACDADELVDAIYAAARGDEFTCVKISRILYGSEQPAIKTDSISQLSSREAEIVHLIAEGLPNKDIAEKLFLSVHTVKTHRKNIIKKLGFSFKNAAELILVLGSLNDFI
jgi:DNA-binding NarL/FixJ family response regulator